MSKITCDDCGLCCMHVRAPLLLPSERAKLPKRLQRELAEWVESPRRKWLNDRCGVDTPCLWLDLRTGRCREYDHRPAVCREYEVDCPSCREVRRRWWAS
jgi:Fe-S-cluster containining protein